MTAEDLAKLFHDNYERLAPSHGYETRKDSAVPWESVPERNKSLMIATCAAVLDEVARREAKAREVFEAIRDFDRVEVVKDAFAYDRLQGAYREAARQGLAFLNGES